MLSYKYQLSKNQSLIFQCFLIDRVSKNAVNKEAFKFHILNVPFQLFTMTRLNFDDKFAGQG